MAEFFKEKAYDYDGKINFNLLACCLFIAKPVYTVRTLLDRAGHYEYFFIFEHSRIFVAIFWYEYK